MRQIPGKRPAAPCATDVSTTLVPGTRRRTYDGGENLVVQDTYGTTA